MNAASDMFKDKRLQLQQLTEKYVDKLLNIWTRIFDTEICTENLEKLSAHLTNIYEDLVTESKEKEQFVINEINKLKMEAVNLKRMLNIDLSVKTREDVPLLVVQLHLSNYLEKLRDCLRQRKEEIYQLLLEQNSLCEELDEPLRPLIADPLPTTEEIQDFKHHLEKLKEERLERLNKMSVMRHEIKDYLQTLERQVTKETEDRLLNPKEIKLNKETFMSLARLHECYGRQVQEVHEKINDVKAKLQTLWDRLETSPNTRKKFNRYTQYTQSSFDALYAELNRCQSLRDQNIKKYVNQIREQILEWCNKTLQSEEQGSRFSKVNSKCYTDDLLTLHEMELEDLKQYYENNKEIFELYENRKVLWDRMIALEAKASDPARYNNRGGQLLKEEKERKIIATKLPKIERKITELVKQYEEREKKQFMVYGKNILDVMAMEWDHKRQAKQQVSSARKKAQTSQATSSLSCAAAASRTPMSKRNISIGCAAKPSLNTNINKSEMLQPKNRKLNHIDKTTPLAKRSLLYAVNSPGVFLKPTNVANRTTSTSPARKPHVLGTTNRRRSGRRSSGTAARKQRRSMNRSNIVHPQIIITDASSNQLDATYDTFENCITPASRSSINPNFCDSSSTTSREEYKRMRLGSSESTSSTTSPQFDPKTTPSRNALSPSTSSSRKLTPKNLPIII